MRELLFKNMTAWERNKKDVFVQESIEKDGVLAMTTRRCIYFVKDKVPVKDPADLKNIAEMKQNGGEFKKHFHVLKERDSVSGVDRLMCKVAGTFYAMVNNYLYCIIFVHTFKISFSPTPQK